MLSLQAPNEPQENWLSRVSDQVRHKPACVVTEDGCKLEISDLGRRGFVLSK